MPVEVLGNVKCFSLACVKFIVVFALVRAIKLKFTEQEYKTRDLKGIIFL